MITAVPLDGVGEIAAGSDLGAIISGAVAATASLGPGSVGSGDVIVVAHKAISKAEGRTRRLSEVSPGVDALALAGELDKDPRLVQVVLDESVGVVRAAHGVLVVETRHGFVCANAGVDASNVAGDDVVLMLPVDPDASARRLRAGLGELGLGSGATGDGTAVDDGTTMGERAGAAPPAVVVTDSFGRAWRTGQVDVAIGVAGIIPLEDWRGGTDVYGRELRATVIGIADQIAATADLARRKDSAQPFVVVRGAGRHITAEDGPGVAPLLRDRSRDLFR